jgi:exodeoxyribonuclease V alpha subunit
LIDPYSRWYSHRPVLIGRNDYGLELFNGDVGIVMPDRTVPHTTTAWFQGPSGGMRRISPRVLPQHETVYAMTVHKSQGSEFDHVMLVLPARSSPVLTRELLYTAVTRARASLELWGSKDIILAAVANRTRRASGLRDALWAAGVE